MPELKEWIAQLFTHPDLLRMGHCQRTEDLNLGMGWLYYGLVRLIRPRQVVVIGSLRGFVPLVFGRALEDNLEKGQVDFVDPSLVDDFWTDPARVEAHFRGYGVGNVRHHLMTTQEFVESAAYRRLQEVEILFVDGYHTSEQARFDYEAFRHLIPPHGLALFHDSVEVGPVGIYGPHRSYQRRVRDYLDELAREPGIQRIDLPFAKGLSLVRRETPADGAAG